MKFLVVDDHELIRDAQHLVLIGIVVESTAPGMFE